MSPQLTIWVAIHTTRLFNLSYKNAAWKVPSVPQPQQLPAKKNQNPGHCQYLFKVKLQQFNYIIVSLENFLQKFQNMSETCMHFVSYCVEDLVNCSYRKRFILYPEDSKMVLHWHSWVKIELFLTSYAKFYLFCFQIEIMNFIFLNDKFTGV